MYTDRDHLWDNGSVLLRAFKTNERILIDDSVITNLCAYLNLRNEHCTNINECRLYNRVYNGIGKSGNDIYIAKHGCITNEPNCALYRRFSLRLQGSVDRAWYSTPPEPFTIHPFSVLGKSLSVCVSCQIGHSQLLRLSVSCDRNG